MYTEQNYNFFKVIAVVDKKEIAVLLLMSGDIASKDYDLSSLMGKKVEIRFIFEGDTGVRAAGPSITLIEIKLGECARPIRNHQKLIPGASGAENFGDLGVGILDERPFRLTTLL